MNWRDDPNKGVRTATQILASHSIIIRELEKEGKVPLGVYDQVKMLEQSDQSYHAVEEVSANSSRSLDS